MILISACYVGLVSRPGWHESIWAPYFVIAALYSGIALVILVTACFRRGYHLEAFITKQHFVRMAFIMVALGAVYVYLTFADLLPSAYVGETGPTEVIYGMLFGPVAIWFWLFLVMGTVLPIVVVALPWTRNVPGIVIASVFVLIAMWIKRLIMVIETSAYDRLTNSFGPLFHFTWVSATATIAGVAAIALLLMLLFRVVPILSIAEVREVSDEHQQSVDGHARADSGSHGRAAGAIVAVLLVMLALGAVGVANAQPSYADSTAPIIVVVAEEQGDQNTVTATVMLNGSPVQGARVNFYESTTMFAPGDNQVPLGVAETGSDGIARVTYTDATTGERTITASYFPDVMGDPVVATTTLDVTTAAQMYEPPPPRILAGAGQVLAASLLVLVTIVLVILVAQVVRVRRACRPALVSDGPSR